MFPSCPSPSAIINHKCFVSARLFAQVNVFGDRFVDGAAEPSLAVQLVHGMQSDELSAGDWPRL